MPGLFIIKALLAAFSFIFYIEWFKIMCTTYIATLGGIRWQPYIGDAIFYEDLNGFKPAPTSKVAIIFTIIHFASFIPIPVSIIALPLCYVLTIIGVALSVTGFGAIIGIPLLLLCALIALIPSIAIPVYLIITVVINPIFFKLKPINNNAE